MMVIDLGCDNEKPMMRYEGYEAWLVRSQKGGMR